MHGCSKNDFNEIGTLAHYKLLDEDIFIKEDYWVILKVWSLLKKDIKDRRERDSFYHMKNLEDLRTKACEHAQKEDTKVYERFCLDDVPAAGDTASGQTLRQNKRLIRNASTS